ncbi:serine carboxypeptidase-like 19 isoform X2 [Arachis hypogaea]|uniref:serine carboxypeptidase-like 19 isoform X2 n=1 Tax=Arachis hypogaea TaxID=3818 RepID=UPI0007886C63|nr:serine carboxypeptidase-like 19 isoform X2 [Arachis hypogaea]
MVAPSSLRTFQVLFLVLTILLQIAFHQIEAASAKVEHLPGFDGPLPFHLETGYVGLGDTNDDLQVFYYFIKSENDPKNDPLMLWLTGGPGCSSFSGLAYQIGPIKFKIEEYNGSLPNLVLRPQSWTKVSNIIFVDLPFGTGFSYAKDVISHRSDWKLIHHTHQFIRKWFIEHPEFLSNKFYMGADSYSGIPAPAIVQEISIGNDKGLHPWINLQGYLLGNPITTKKEPNDRIPYVHGMGLISDELYLSLQRNCKGEYMDIDSENELCLRDMKYFQKIYGFFLGTQWANDASVRKALHVRGEIGKWERCYTTDFEYEITSSFEFHVNLSAKGYRSLIYSGDHDVEVPFSSTQAWIRALNYSIVDDWRPWLLNGQVAGFTRTYANQMTFATVKGAGHTAPEYKPDEGFAMFSRWLSNVPL